MMYQGCATFIFNNIVVPIRCTPPPHVAIYQQANIGALSCCSCRNLPANAFRSAPTTSHHFLFAERPVRAFGHVGPARLSTLSQPRYGHFQPEPPARQCRSHRVKPDGARPSCLLSCRQAANNIPINTSPQANPPPPRSHYEYVSG